MYQKTIAPSFFNSLRNQYILVALLSFLVYANTLQHGFVLDDIAVIQNNTFVKQGISGIPKICTTFYWQGYWNSNGGLYRPLSLIAFAIEHQISPKSPFIYHFFNVVYYSILCCLLLKFFNNIFPKTNKFFFLFAVLLFIVHPIHTEVVANIKSRDEIFALLFFILACNQLYSTGVKTNKSILLASFFFLLALLSKEGTVTLLPIIFLIDYQQQKKIVPLLKQRFFLLITTLTWLIWHHYIIASSASPRLTYTYADNSLLASSSIFQQKATALGMFATYMVKAFLPYSLSYDYSFNQIPIINLFSFQAIAGLLILTALIYVAYKNITHDWLITFCIAILVLPLLLTSNIFFNIGATMADRFLFTSTIGSCLLICWFIFKLFKNNISAIQYILIAILLLFSIQTFTRNKNWESNYTLFKHDVKNAPNSARVHYNNALALQQTTAPGTNLQPYIAEYELCLQIDPKYQDALINLGAVYAQQKQYSTALALYHRALNQNKNDPALLGNIGDAFFRGGNKDSAIYYMQQTQISGNANAELYNMLGTAFFEKQNYTQARASFEKGLEKDTTNYSLYLNYGNVLAVTNNFPQALNAFLHSYQLNSTNPQISYFIAITYNKLGDTINTNKFFDQYKSLSK